MTTTAMPTLIFKNQAGEYFVLPEHILEQGRVSTEQALEAERLLAEQGDMQGYAAKRTPLGPFILLGSALIGFAAEIFIGFTDVTIGGGTGWRGGHGPERPL